MDGRSFDFHSNPLERIGHLPWLRHHSYTHRKCNSTIAGGTFSIPTSGGVLLRDGRPLTLEPGTQASAAEATAALQNVAAFSTFA